ncbi:MAG: hypothetical protein IJ569_03570 [Prevotella sp.]|nr:hypothetical protein [Prevotella sp.]
MKRLVLILIFCHLSLAAALAQIVMGNEYQYKGPQDIYCSDIMGVPLEGPDSVFIPALEQVGMKRVVSEDDEPDTYYFTGNFYGIKSNLIVNVDEKSKLLSSALVTSGPYRTFALYDRNYRYLLLKLQRQYGNFDAKGDGSLHTMTNIGYVKISNILHENKSRTIQVFYLNTTPYYKDALSMGLKGNVQEVITENPVSEGQVEHFDMYGKNTTTDIIDREYNATGYLVKAAMLEPSGEKSILEYEYDNDGLITKRTLTNVAEKIRSVNEYSYSSEGELRSQSQKVFDKSGECILSINMKYEYTEHDDNGNWTQNELKLIYWEKGRQPQNMKVKQTRTISYWEED